MPEITLYTPPDIPFGTKVERALNLKKLPFRVVAPQGPEDFQRWSPETGLLPVLQIDDERHHDSGHILDVLDREFPEPPLLSADPKVARSQRRLEQWVEAAFTFYWMHYLRAVADPETQVPAWGPANLAGEYSRRLDDLVNFLGGRPFFYSETISRADLAVYAFLARMADAVGHAAQQEVNRRGALRRHLERVESATSREPGAA